MAGEVIEKEMEMNYTKTFSCGCTMLVRNSGAGDIHMCSKHKAAPKLYEALQEARIQIEYLGDKFTKTSTSETVLFRIKQALAEAEGRSE